MLMAAIALIAQTPTLPADTFEAPRMCATVATVADMAKKPQIRLTSQFMYYLMHAARARPGDKVFTDRIEELAGGDQTIETPSVAAAQILAPVCEARFPRPAPSQAVRLPTDPFQRDVMCLGELSLLQGVAQQMKEDGGDAAPLARIEAVLNPLLERMNDATLAKQGINGEGQFLKQLGESLMASVALGEPVAVAAACGVTGL